MALFCTSPEAQYVTETCDGSCAVALTRGLQSCDEVTCVTSVTQTLTVEGLYSASRNTGETKQTLQSSPSVTQWALQPLQESQQILG